MFKHNIRKTGKSFILSIDGVDAPIKLEKIKGFKESLKTAWNSEEFEVNTGYIKHGSEMFSSHLFNTNIDLLFINYEGEIIGMYKSFEPNNLTNLHKGTKFIYILGEDTIKLNKIKNDANIRHHKS